MIETTGTGGSAFADAEIPLTDRTFAPGVPAMATAGMFAGAGTAYLRSAGFDSAPHPAPARQWVIMLRGTIEVTTSDGDRRQFAPGDLVLAADTSGRGHTTVAVGEAPFEALFIPAEQ
ncbi:cupin domain-containing protein [Nocardia sp. NBC_00511]|uniref:cupin domain-containing protein n=1 Tax=Nocardia sp. NBC_00511 TaxID=2903591 RepID=UPI0030E4EDEF